MNTCSPIQLLRLALLLVACGVTHSFAHDHYPAGIVDTNSNGQPDPGEPLQLVGITGSPRTFHLLPRAFGYRPVQLCGGYFTLDEESRTLFPLDGFSFVALSDGQIEAEAPNHAHPGSQIWMEVTSVTGPSGAKFGFWDENRSRFFDTPTVSFITNQPTGNFQFVLSEGPDAPGEDPQGHIHGRSWTADKPGEYLVGFRLVDRSTNRPGGSPWHSPSQVYTFRFVAGPAFQLVPQKVTGVGNVLTWPSQMGIDAAVPTQIGITFAIERNTSLSSNGWQQIGTVVGTTGATATYTDAAPPAGNVFYRLKYLWSTP